MRAQDVFSFAGPLEGAEESAGRSAEGRGVQVSGVHRGFDPRIVGRIVDLYVQVSGAQREVLIAGDLANAQLTGGHADGEVRGGGNPNRPAKICFWGMVYFA